MILIHPMPRMTDAGRQRVLMALETGCTGYRCKDGRTGALTRRIVAASVQIHLQCTHCGKSVAGAMARKDHFFWQDYQPWDSGLVAAQEARLAQDRADYGAKIAAQEAVRRVAQEARIREIAGYAEWCRTSPDWHYLRGRVLWRARNICEACLTNPATTVHHLTYERGKLPPAWYLRSVCQSCHDRLHQTGDDWCEAGMERN